jgi:ribosomal protein L12E/L44/L45/RPP1/RPP2
MKKALALTLVVFCAFLALQGIASAKTVSGKVTAVDAAAKTLSVSQTDELTGVEEKVTVSVTDTTAFSGVTGLDGVNVDDEVTVEATEDAATGTWNAVSVSSSAVK